MFPFNRPFRRSNQNYSSLGHSQISGSLIEEIEPIMAPGLIVQFLLLLRCRNPARVQLGKKDGSEMLAYMVTGPFFGDLGPFRSFSPKLELVQFHSPYLESKSIQFQIRSSSDFFLKKFQICFIKL